MAIDWEAAEELDVYGSSCLVSDFLVVAHYRGQTKINIYWIETGESTEAKTYGQNMILSMAPDKGNGIYALVKKPREGYEILLLELEGVGNPFPELKEITSRSFRESTIPNDEAEGSFENFENFESLESFALHPPIQLFLHYSPRTSPIESPSVLLLGHLRKTVSTGLIIYEFAGNDYPYNPFATPDFLTNSVYIDIVQEETSTDPVKYLSCPESKFIQGFTCETTCGSTYYIEGRRCARCHFSCGRCTGPKRNECTRCKNAAEYDLLLGECSCKMPRVSAQGGCGEFLDSLNREEMTFQFNGKRKKAPSYVFDLRNRFSESFISFRKVQTSTDSSISSDKTYSVKKSKLLVPVELTATPDEFTFGFWFHDHTIGTTNNDGKILSAFDSITITYKHDQKTITFEIEDIGISKTLETTINSWKFIAMSLRKTTLGSTMTFFVSSSNGIINSHTKREHRLLDNLPYKNHFILGGSTGAYIGVFRELFYTKRYYSKEDMEVAKSLVYHEKLQFKDEILTYWKLNTRYDNGFKEEFHSGRSEDDGGIDDTTNWITSDLKLREAMMSQSKWGVVGTGFDLFGYSKFPGFSFDTLNFGANELEPKINLNTFSLLSGIIQKGDVIRYHFNGCSGENIGTAKVFFTAADKVKIEKNVRFVSDKSVRGRFVDSCYCNQNENWCIHLGRTYFPLLPTQIHPAHGKTNLLAPTPIQLSLIGGDQSYGDKLTLINMERDVLSTIKETMIIDERDSGYSSYSTIRRTNGQYDMITTRTLDSGVYTIGWRPSYMSYLVNQRNVIYKNLYNTWTLQEPPRVRFPPFDRVPGVFKHAVVHKGEFYYIDLVGYGQADGDQIILCDTGCNYPNRRSRPFQRENGRYPPIWIGEEDDIYGIFRIAASNRLAEKLFICWRSAARTAILNPEDDQWTSLFSLYNPEKRAHITINHVKSDKPEIEKISLYLGDLDIKNKHHPVKTPVLYHGDTIWFRLAYKHTFSDSNQNREVKSSFEPGGKIEISRVIYDDYYKTSYTLERVWVQKCKQPPSPCVINKLKLDEDRVTNGLTTKYISKYTLREIPHSTMRPGHDYMLIIYGETFKFIHNANANVNVNDNDNYLGSKKSGIREFEFLFKYQESIFFELPPERLISSDTKIRIRGTNLGNLYIPSSTFVESRKLFGVAVEVIAKPQCGNRPIRASYIPEHLEQNPTEIVLQDLDLSRCTDSNVLSVNLKLMKIADDFPDYPLWSSTNNSVPITIGKVGCDPSCKTCNGPNSFNCLTCDIDSSFPYLYKSRCSSKCGNDMPYSNLIFDRTGHNIAYYECTDKCKDGTYLNEKLGVCFECNPQCATCKSASANSCLTCRGSYMNENNGINYMNVYKELYRLKGICFLECPKILRIEGRDSSNVIIEKGYSHECVEIPKMKSEGIRVDIQDVIFPEKLNIRRPIRLRALLTDQRVSNPPQQPLRANYIWSTHPVEKQAESGFATSDRRVFQNYTDQNIKHAITSLNMNAFNYKSDKDPMRIIVRAWANEDRYFNYDVVELYGNRPPELRDVNVKIRHSNSSLGTNDLTSRDKLKTGINLDVHINSIQDADDIFPILYFKVILVPRSLALPNNASEASIPESALLILAQLPEQQMVVYSSKHIKPKDGVVHLKDIFIPPLINGPQAILKSEYIYSSKVSCDLFVYAEDRFLGVSRVKFILNFEESYDPDKGNETLGNLTILMKGKEDRRELTWNDALTVAHTLRTINPEHTVYYMAYSHCTRDDQCNNGGKCVTSGGWSKCICAGEYTGITCSWLKKKMIIEEELIGIVVRFLNNTVFTPVNSKPDYEVESTDIVDELANVLIGILYNPEPIRAEYFNPIISLAEHMTKINYITGGRLENFEKNNVLKALDAVVKYVYYHIRQDIYEFYLLGELMETLGDQQVAQYNEMRNTFATEILRIKNALNRFIDAISLVQYPLTSPYIVEHDTFEVFLSSELEESMFTGLGNSLAIQLRSGDGYIKIPSSILNTMRKEVSINEEFKIKIVKWKENPYLFSEYHSGVCTPVFNFALMNSDSKLIDMELREPIVFFAPISKAIKNLADEPVRCMYFNEKNQIQSKIRKVTKINVNQLDLTDEEKMALYPEWNPDFYHSKNLIVEEESYTTTTIDYPEYMDARGLSSYGNILDPTEYLDHIACAVYSLNEVAGVAERKRSHNRGFPPIDFIYDYDPMDYVYFNISMYICTVIGVLLIISFMGSYLLDLICLPKHQEFIESHRSDPAKKFNDKETTANDKVNSILSIDSGGREDSDKTEDKVKVSVDVGGINPSDTKIPKRHNKHNRRRLDKKGTGRGRSAVNDTSKATQSKDTMTDDGFLASQVTNPILGASQSKVKLKADGDISATNIHNSTNENQVTGEWLISDPQTTHPGEGGLKNIFTSMKSAVGGKRKIHGMITGTGVTENIFDKEHIAKIERETFKFGNMFFYSNLFLNLLFRTNNLFTRPARCFVMYSYAYIMLFWCAVFTSIVTNSLMNPENGKPISFLASKHTWIIFVAPILSSILLYLVAGVYKADEKRVGDCKTIDSYRNHL